MEEIKTGNTNDGQKIVEETVNESRDAEAKQASKEKKTGDYYVKFIKPYSFKGKEYYGVDLEGIQNLTTKEKIKIDRMYEHIETAKPRIPTLSTMYAVCVAVHITKLPIEFFYNMRNSEFRIVETAIIRGFFTPA